MDAPGLNEEQARSLREGMRHRAGYYGWADGGDEVEALTLALAWWAAWWRDRRSRAEVRGADLGTGELFAREGVGPSMRAGHSTERPAR